MAKTSSVEKNKHRRHLTKKFLGKRTRLKTVIMNKETSIEERFEATMKLAALPRNSAKNRIRNRCEVSGRPRAYYRKFRLARVMLRDLANKGLIPGLTKSSW